MIKKIRSFFDRNYHLLFNKGICIHFYYADYVTIKYNEIYNVSNGCQIRCLGKNNWFLILKEDKKNGKDN